MNILLLTNCLKQPDDRETGVPAVVSYFAIEWSKLGHRVIVVHNSSKFPKLFYFLPEGIYNVIRKKSNTTIPSFTSRKPLSTMDGGVEILRIPIFRSFIGAPFLEKHYQRQFDKIQTELIKRNFVPDIITGHWLHPQLSLVSRLAEVYGGVNTGIVIHGTMPEELSVRTVQEMDRIDHIFFRSEYMKRVGQQKHSNWANKMKVCFSGIPDSFIDERQAREDWKSSGFLKILYVGRLITYKRVDAILDALSIAFPNRSFEFDIVGEGVLEPSLREQCDKLNIQEKVKFHGRVTREQVISMMSKADCFVMISEKETFGLVYLEAMAAGAITIAAYDGGVDGIIKHGINGFLCNQGDCEELAKLLIEINDLSVDSANRIRQSANETVMNYSDKKVAKRYLEDLQSESHKRISNRF